MLDLTYSDSEENAMKRLRIASFTLSSGIALTKLYSFPSARPRFELREAGEDVVIEINVS
jgi:hypothetical protein